MYSQVEEQVEKMGRKEKRKENWVEEYIAMTKQRMRQGQRAWEAVHWDEDGIVL